MLNGKKCGGLENDENKNIIFLFSHDKRFLLHFSQGSSTYLGSKNNITSSKTFSFTCLFDLPFIYTVLEWMYVFY